MSDEDPETWSARGSASISYPWRDWNRFPPDLAAEYYAAIGEVCFRWAWLERQLPVIAREVLGIDKPEGFSVMAGMSMSTISAVLIALSTGGFPKGHPELCKRVGELGTKMNNIGDMRNQYAHAYWGYENEINPRLGFYRFKKPEEKIEPRWIDKPVSAVQADARDLRELQVKAQQLTRDLKDALRGK